MKISVLVPTYNRARKMARAVDSVLNQTRRPFEVIVVDDGSTDKTPLLLTKYNGAVKVIRQNNQGVAAARNRAIKEARGESLALLDSDDWWLPAKMEEQIAFHQKNPDLLISQTNEIWLRNRVKVNPKRYHEKQAGWIFEKCLERCLISPSAVLINRKVLREVGLFDESLPACEDYDLWLRITRLFRVGLVKENLVVKTGGHQDQLSAKFWGLDRFRVQALEKILNFPLGKEQQKEVFRVLVAKLTILKNGSLKRGDTGRAQTYQKKIERYKAVLKTP
ncbi:MAG TPA: glycosyltransferase family A protein [Candidatus Subteraquimicrobiales bacterium]